MFLSTIPMVLVPEGGVHYESEIEHEQQSSVGDITTPSTHILIIFLIAITFINFGRNSIATIFPQYLFLPSPDFGVSSESIILYIKHSISCYNSTWPHRGPNVSENRKRKHNLVRSINVNNLTRSSCNFD